ncbi:glycosyl transferase, partial [Clostridium tertium]|nr:glycosyl transferase [Clostridium tertium]
CYSILGDYDAAYYYNELTALYGGNIDKVDYNRKFLKSKFEELGKTTPDLDYKLIDRRYRFF